MLLRRCLLAWCALMGLLAPLAYANTEPRLALLIGNASYKASPLANPVNDVRLMEGALIEAGFTVIKAENASIRDMRRLVRDFGDKLKASGGVGLFYFAGHGVQVRGENFLVSTDSDIRNEDEVADEALNASVILEKMQTAGNRMNLIILDACRNNPFAVKSRSASAGLATMSAPSGSLVAYSTAPGSVASDGSGKNGLYTEHLAKVIRQSGLPVEEVFKQVRAAVRKESNNTQTPWENTALEGQFFFKAPAQGAATTPEVLAAASKPGGPDPVAIELVMWDSVKTASTAGELQIYIKRYPSGIFTDVAKARIAALGSAASERTANEKAANERAAADRASAERNQASANATMATNPGPLALDMAFWESVKGSQRSNELQAYLTQYPQGVFSALAKARIEEVKNMALSTSNFAQPFAAGKSVPSEAIGVMVLTDPYTGLKTKQTISVSEVTDEKVVYSSGDEIAKDGRVVQARMGEASLKLVSGQLWSFPLKLNTSGEASVIRTDVSYKASGTVRWNIRATNDGKTRVEATVYYFFSHGTYNSSSYGKWLADYSGLRQFPDYFSIDLKGGGAVQGGDSKVAGVFEFR